jgi:hypothetical protein
VAKKHTPKRLVIDTDVAHATGESTSPSSISRNCRDFMHTMLEETAHKVVLTKEIQVEWNKHQSRVALRWRLTMVAQKRVCFIQAPTDQALHQHIEQHAPSENKRKAMLKDVHLVEAASQADKIVISMDEVVRGCFHALSYQAHQLKQLIWINPCQENAAALDWLRDGAEQDKERCLGYGFVPENP